MNVQTRIKPYVFDIIGASSREDVQKKFVKGIKFLGFTHTLFGFLFKDEEDVVNQKSSDINENTLHVAYGNYPREFCKEYFDSGYIAIDAAVVTTLGSEKLFAWDSEEYLKDSRGNHRVKAIETMADGHGIEFGATLTVEVRKGSVFMCGVTVEYDPKITGDREKKKRYFDKVLRKRFEYVKTLCKALYSKLLGEPYNLVRQTKPRYHVYTNYKELSEIKLRFLEYYTQGFTIKEIEHGIGRSDSSMWDYKKDICRAFKARSFESALYRASLLKVGPS